MNQIDLSRVDLNLLVLLEVMLEERHVGRAAQRLNLSPSAVSHGLTRLRRLLHDPLFLKHPRGVVPTERASALAEPVRELLSTVRRVIASSDPFDPVRSQRSFTIGAPDAVTAVVLPAVVARVRDAAPGIRLKVRDLLPNELIGALDTRTVDIALYPQEAGSLPARFQSTLLYEDRFVVAARAGHPVVAAATLDSYCAAEHVLVSHIGDDRGFVDGLLEEQGRARRVVLVVPSFMWALCILAASDLVGTVPESLIRLHGSRFGITAADAPVPIERSQITAVVPKSALSDSGLTWVLELLTSTCRRTLQAAQTAP